MLPCARLLHQVLKVYSHQRLATSVGAAERCMQPSEQLRRCWTHVLQLHPPAAVAHCSVQPSAGCLGQHPCPFDVQNPLMKLRHAACVVETRPPVSNTGAAQPTCCSCAALCAKLMHSGHSEKTSRRGPSDDMTGRSAAGTWACPLRGIRARAQAVGTRGATKASACSQMN